MKQYVLTPAAGKRLIARAIVLHPAVRAALHSGTVAIVAGTTNGYVAEEILGQIGQSDGFARGRFFRGVTLPPGQAEGEVPSLPNEGELLGDVIIVRGVWEKGKTIFDVVDELNEGDVVLKGANAVDLNRKRAAVLIGHPKAGTTGVLIQAVVGRRVRLILPVGLEKRVADDLDGLAATLNLPGGEGPRLFPVPGEVITEIEALSLLSGAKAELVAGGGVCGAEGSVWLAVSGASGPLEAADLLLHGVLGEPPFSF
jgi:hypothetical protein